MPNIRMVWFDIGRVLYDHLADELIEDLAKQSNPALKPYEVYRKIRESKLVVEFDLGHIGTEEFGEKMQKLLGLADRQWFLARWKRILAPNQLMWRLASSLGRNFYPMGIISNIGELHIEYLEKIISCGAIMQFRPRIYSCREGIDKPNPEIFRIALEKANSEYPWDEELMPDECVFIDDRPENIEAARALGWHAVPHNPAFGTNTFLKLSELGVRI